jgi:pyridoxamine 5'-phosphate oxidase
MRSGLPNVRMVLLKEIEADAFVFYTNYTSAKGQEITASGKAAFVLHWKSLRRQIRVRGTVTREDGPQADAYYNSRSLQSRMGAWASEQSQPLASRGTSDGRGGEASPAQGHQPGRARRSGADFGSAPVEIEFWADGAFRLHDRFRWERPGPGSPWTITRLNP